MAFCFNPQSAEAVSTAHSPGTAAESPRSDLSPGGRGGGLSEGGSGSEEGSEEEEEQEDEDDDDGGGWITPSNIKQVQLDVGNGEAPADVKVGCMTTDFAMQVRMNPT